MGAHADDLDLERLEAWLAAHVGGFRGPLTVQRFGLGQSNPTFAVDAASGRYVLRRKPQGEVLPSAHAVDREFRVLSALWPTGFPTPKPLALCLDEGVIGSIFFVMERVDGKIVAEGGMPGASPTQRFQTYRAMVGTLAQLHGVDVHAVGLADYGRPGNYFARQVARWSRQYLASRTDDIPAMDRLMAWLPTSVPDDDGFCIVHGDYRLDNLIVSPDGGEVRAVLDWELSTLGSPLADLTYLLTNWVCPPELSANRAGLAGLDLEALGIPTLGESLELYCGLSGRPPPRDLDWFFAFNLFRLAGIFQGIAMRVRDGTAAGHDASTYAERIAPLAELAWSFARKAGA